MRTAHLLLALVLAVLPQTATPEEQPQSKANGPTFAESMTWLEEQASAYGRFFMESVGKPTKDPSWLVFRLNPNGRQDCRLTVQTQVVSLDEQYQPVSPSWSQAYTGTFALKDVLVEQVAVRPQADPKYRAFAAKTGDPVECVKILTKPNAMRGTLLGDARVSEHDSIDICFTEKGLAERAAKAVKHMAQLCGAGKKAKEPF